jgi:hypothetical protein
VVHYGQLIKIGVKPHLHQTSHRLLVVDVNGARHFYNWNNELVYISLIITTENKYVTRIKPITMQSPS